MNDFDEELAGSEERRSEEAESADGDATLKPLPMRVIQVLFSPGEAFTAIAKKPAWVGALLLGGALVGLASFLIPVDLIIEFQREQMAARGQAVPASFGNAAGVIRLFSVIGGPVFWVIFASIVAGLALLMFNFFMGGEGKYKQYLAVVAHGLLIPAIGALILTPLRIAAENPQLSISLGSVLEGVLPSGYFLGVLKGLDVFNLWGFFLMAVGVSKIDRKHSVGGAFAGLFAIVLVFALIGGIFQR